MAASMRTCMARDLRVFKTIARHKSSFATCTKSTGVIPIYRAKNHLKLKTVIPLSSACRLHTTPFRWSDQEVAQQSGEVEKEEEDFHSIIKDTERSKGEAHKHEFQAETRKLLDIVAKSLYSEKEVFIRELISNASDALEKMRYLEMTGADASESPLEIHIAVDDQKKTFIIQDTGIGMTKEEMMENLGTIARSGSKAFLDSVDKKSGSSVNSNIIGQFGVGFYSSFMVAEKVHVYSRSHEPGSVGYKWTSDGTGSYEISEAEGCQRGTKIVLHLRGESYDFAKEDIISEVVKKYSNFVGVPIFLNGKRANIIQALWTMDPKEITQDMHEEFYRFIGNAYDKPRYQFQYKTDAPVNIRALFYVPEYKPTMFDLSRDTDVSVNLYSRKVMIMPRANYILPKWLRFFKGVVDSEDIPLNLSRELLQDSALIRKLRNVLTGRILKFLSDCAKKDAESYRKFYSDYGLFLREGIVTTHEQDQREEISKLLRFESSKTEKGEYTTLQEYASRMKAGARNIYYLSAPSRELAETSPYFEALQEQDTEVLFLYEPYDELVLMNLGQFDKKTLKSIENDTDDAKADTEKVDNSDENSLKQTEVDDLTGWIQGVLQHKVTKVKVTQRLASHPCIVTVAEMGAARHFLKTTLAESSPEERYRLLQPTLEINPRHTLIKKMYSLMKSNPELGRLVTEQLYENAMINAGLMDDPRTMVGRINELLEKALEKH